MNPQDDDRDERLPETDAALLAQALAPVLPAGDGAARMKAKILRGIAAEQAAGAAADAPPETRVGSAAAPGAPTGGESAAASATHAFREHTQHTVHARDRHWQPVTRGVEMCLLHEDAHSRSFLLRMQPDSFLLPHRHEMSEESILLEGDAVIGENLRLVAGDYHFSPAGGLHPLLQSPGGCIVFVRGEKGFSPRLTTGLFKRLLRGFGARRDPGSS